MIETAPTIVVAGGGLLGELLQVQPVDQVDDLQVPRQQALEQRHRPGLERFRQQRVVRVVERLGGDAPGSAQGRLVLVDEEAHEFRDREGRMGVVELDRGMVRQRQQAAMLAQMAAHQILQRRRGEEIFLPQAQLLALRGAVARIEHLRDRLGPRLGGLGLDMSPWLNVSRWSGSAALRRHRRSMLTRRPRQPTIGMSCATASTVFVGMPDVRGSRRRRGQARPSRRSAPGRRSRARTNSQGVPVESHSSGRSCCHPSAKVCRNRPWSYRMPYPMAGIPRRRHALHETGGEAPEAAIAEGRIRLGRAEAVEVDPQSGEGLARRRVEAQIGECLRKAAPDQEFHREIGDLLGGLAAGRSLCRGVDDMVANGERSGAIPVELARVLRPPADVIGELRKNGRTQRCAPFLGLRPDAAWRLEPLTRRLRYASGTFRRALRIALDREVVRHETATSSQPDTRGNSCRTERFLTMRLVSAPLTARALVRTLLTGNREAGRADGFCGVATGFGDREAPRSRGHLALK